MDTEASAVLVELSVGTAIETLPILVSKGVSSSIARASFAQQLEAVSAKLAEILEAIDALPVHSPTAVRTLFETPAGSSNNGGTVADMPNPAAHRHVVDLAVSRLLRVSSANLESLRARLAVLLNHRVSRLTEGPAVSSPRLDPRATTAVIAAADAAFFCIECKGQGVLGPQELSSLAAILSVYGSNRGLLPPGPYPSVRGLAHMVSGMCGLGTQARTSGLITPSEGLLLQSMGTVTLSAWRSWVLTSVCDCTDPVGEASQLAECLQAGAAVLGIGLDPQTPRSIESTRANHWWEDCCRTAALDAVSQHLSAVHSQSSGRPASALASAADAAASLLSIAFVTAGGHAVLASSSNSSKTTGPYDVDGLHSAVRSLLVPDLLRAVEACWRASAPDSPTAVPVLALTLASSTSLAACKAVLQTVDARLATALRTFEDQLRSWTDDGVTQAPTFAQALWLDAMARDREAQAREQQAAAKLQAQTARPSPRRAVQPLPRPASLSSMSSALMTAPQAMAAPQSHTEMEVLSPIPGEGGYGQASTVVPLPMEQGREDRIGIQLQQRLGAVMDEYVAGPRRDARQSFEVAYQDHRRDSSSPRQLASARSSVSPGLLISPRRPVSPPFVEPPPVPSPTMIAARSPGGGSHAGQGPWGRDGHAGHAARALAPHAPMATTAVPRRAAAMPVTMSLALDDLLGEASPRSQASPRAGDNNIGAVAVDSGDRGRVGRTTRPRVSVRPLPSMQSPPGGLHTMDRSPRLSPIGTRYAHAGVLPEPAPVAVAPGRYGYPSMQPMQQDMHVTVLEEDGRGDGRVQKHAGYGASAAVPAYTAAAPPPYCGPAVAPGVGLLDLDSDAEQPAAVAVPRRQQKDGRRATSQVVQTRGTGARAALHSTSRPSHSISGPVDPVPTFAADLSVLVQEEHEAQALGRRAGHQLAQEGQQRKSVRQLSSTSRLLQPTLSSSSHASRSGQASSSNSIGPGHVRSATLIDRYFTSSEQPYGAPGTHTAVRGHMGASIKATRQQAAGKSMSPQYRDQSRHSNVHASRAATPATAGSVLDASDDSESMEMEMEIRPIMFGLAMGAVRQGMGSISHPVQVAGPPHSPMSSPVRTAAATQLVGQPQAPVRTSVVAARQQEVRHSTPVARGRSMASASKQAPSRPSTAHGSAGAGTRGRVNANVSSASSASSAVGTSSAPGSASGPSKRMSAASLSRLSRPRTSSASSRGGDASPAAGWGRGLRGDYSSTPIRQAPGPAGQGHTPHAMPAGAATPLQLAHPRLKKFAMGNGVLYGHNDEAAAGKGKVTRGGGVRR